MPKFPLLILSLYCISFVGCTESLDVGREVVSSEIWMSSRYSSAPASWLHLNFYQQLNEYPEYGIVHYSYDSTKFRHVKKDYYEDSLRMIRSEFGNAYRDGILKQWSNELSRPVLWKIEFVAILLTDHGRENEPDCLGSIIPASELFNDRKTISDIVQEYDLKRGRHRTDALKYPMIEIHQINENAE